MKVVVVEPNDGTYASPHELPPRSYWRTLGPRSHNGSLPS